MNVEGRMILDPTRIIGLQLEPAGFLELLAGRPALEEQQLGKKAEARNPECWVSVCALHRKRYTPELSQYFSNFLGPQSNSVGRRPLDHSLPWTVCHKAHQPSPVVDGGLDFGQRPRARLISVVN